jgi:hypothetical protein
MSYPLPHDLHERSFISFRAYKIRPVVETHGREFEDISCQAFATIVEAEQDVARADETVAPSCSLQIRGAGPIFRKQPLKLWQRVRKGQIVALENVCSRWMKRHLHDCTAFTGLAQKQP